MAIHRTLTFAAALGMASLVACDTGENEFETTDQEIMTQPGTETMEVEVPVQDTLLSERETTVDVDVDTTEIEGELPDDMGDPERQQR